MRHGQVQLCERNDAKISLCSPAEFDVLNPGPVDQGMFDNERFNMQRVYACNDFTKNFCSV